jgi:hypothetical protein
MYVALKMASQSVTIEMCNAYDELMSSCNVAPIASPPIGLKGAPNLDIEAIWQLFISQL